MEEGVGREKVKGESGGGREAWGGGRRMEEGGSRGSGRGSGGGRKWRREGVEEERRE